MPLRTRNSLLFVTSLALLFCALPLFQFHCLDCGQIGWYFYSGRHVCAAIVERCGQKGPQGLGLLCRTQFRLWVYAICTGLIGYLVFTLTRL